MAVGDSAGVPVAVHIDSANRMRSKLVEPTFQGRFTLATAPTTVTRWISAWLSKLWR